MQVNLTEDVPPAVAGHALPIKLASTIEVPSSLPEGWQRGGLARVLKVAYACQRHTHTPTRGSTLVL